MESPALLTEDTLQQLKQIVDEFPYFQIARMLYLKNLAVLNDIRFGAELKKMAIYVPDRRKLFTLIEGERFGLQLQSAKEENPTREDAFSLIDAFLSNREEEEPKTDASLLFQPSVSSDYIYWSLTKHIISHRLPGQTTHWRVRERASSVQSALISSTGCF